MLLPFNAVTVISAPLPFLSPIPNDVVIPKTSPSTYPEPPVLLVKLIDDTWPELLVETVAVAPVPLPVIAYKGTFAILLWLGLNPVPAFVMANVLIGPPTCSIYPWTAVDDVESLTWTPRASLAIDDAWVVVVIPTFNFLGNVLIAFGSNLSIIPVFVSNLGL